MISTVIRQLLPIVAVALIASPATLAQKAPVHTVTTTKFTVEDAEVSKASDEARIHVLSHLSEELVNLG